MGGCDRALGHGAAQHRRSDDRRPPHVRAGRLERARRLGEGGSRGDDVVDHDDHPPQGAAAGHQRAVQVGARTYSSDMAPLMEESRK